MWRYLEHDFPALEFRFLAWVGQIINLVGLVSNNKDVGSAIGG